MRSSADVRCINSSVSQLACDFGEYPLKDMTYNIALRDFTFKVRNLNLLVKLEIYFVTLWTLMFGKQDFYSDLPPDLVDLLPRKNIFSTLLDEFYSIIGNLEDSDDLSSWKKITIKFVFIFLVFIMLPFFFIYFIARAIFGVRALMNKINSCSGMYYPFFENVIFISGDISDKRNFKEMVIAHEHIHFLQRKLKLSPRINQTKFNNYFDKIFITNLNDHDFLIYLCDLKEVEARFHEFVVSFYKLNFHIPRDYRGFLKIIFSVQSFNDFLNLVKSEFSDESVFFGEFHNFKNSKFIEFRNLTPAIEIIKLIDHLKSNEMKIRFMSELLSVVYANLLGVYVGEHDKLLFLESVPKMDLYEELYVSQ